ncbi:MAG: DUF1501 domain-containing protein [Pseudomonadota bacterium]
MTGYTLSRRSFLGRTLLGTACSLAASPLVTPVVLAETPGENRLVVIILRGGMDGLGVVQPYGDAGLSALRPGLGHRPGNGITDLDGFFGLADPFADLLPLWRAGELGFVQAVSTPYRNKRSHFDGQDFLENGGNKSDGQLTPGRDGWLNRALSLIPGARADTAMAVGQDNLLILNGDAPTGAWSPTNELSLADDERRLLSLLYANDPLFAKALRGAERLSERTGPGAARETGRTLAQFTAEQLNGPSRIAAFSLGGWDTHKKQNNALLRPAKQLTQALLELRSGLGRNWDRTAVIAITEFGRTARENGSGGTDHGTGGAMMLAGGALRGGKIFGTWPGLGEGALYQNRDLMPTDDVRRYAAWALAGTMGLNRSSLSETVFPGVDLGGDPGIIA